ncbi:MAG TPA: YHS domain-containing protein [Polyangia bacterium]|nr:YHS domain-containing protein [Polyangia bacterium]
MARDPVCGQEVDALRARAVSIYGGRTHYFCSAEHKAEFSRDPERFLAAPEPAVPREVSRKETSRKEKEKEKQREKEKEKEKEKEQAKAKEARREREDDTPLPAPVPPGPESGPTSMSDPASASAPAARPSVTPASPEDPAPDAAPRPSRFYVLVGVALLAMLGILSFWLTRR